MRLRMTWGDLSELVSSFGTRASVVKLARFAMVCWGIWFNRNQLVYNKSRGDFVELVSWVAGQLEEFQDAAIPLRGSSFRVGTVIRDSEVKVVLASSKLLNGCFSVNVCEALGLREGLILTKQYGLSVGWVEVDVANVAAGVNLSLPCRSVACFVFDDISGLCKDVGVSNYKAISKYGNGLAYNLASLAVSSLRDNVWQGYCPCFLSASG
ncbi:hypothetical protein Q3G72_002515 [Acer saccharum]|nr:hypothetical protein Q3G72_002515 [Acer saccharum]